MNQSKAEQQKQRFLQSRKRKQVLESKKNIIIDGVPPKVECSPRHPFYALRRKLEVKQA